MRNLSLFETLVVFGGAALMAWMMWSAGGMGLVLGPLFLGLVVVLFFKFGSAGKRRALEAVSHVNARHTSVVDGTGIAVAYARQGSTPALLLFANGQEGCYEPDELRTVALRADHRGVYRRLMLAVKDPSTPEWLINLRNHEEAKQWRERVTLFAERGGQP